MKTMLVVDVDDDGNVQVASLTAKGRADVEAGENLADDGVWGEYMPATPDAVATMITEAQGTKASA